MITIKQLNKKANKEIQELLNSIGENGVSNDEYKKYCELKGFCYPNRKSRKYKKQIRECE